MTDGLAEQLEDETKRESSSPRWLLVIHIYLNLSFILSLSLSLHSPANYLFQASSSRIPRDGHQTEPRSSNMLGFGAPRLSGEMSGFEVYTDSDVG